MKPYKIVRLLITLNFLILFVLIGCKEDATVSEDFKRLSFYIGAQQIKYYTLNDGLTEGVYYHVRLPYATKEVLEFYDSKLKKEGYKPYIEEYYKHGDREWFTFIDETKKKKPDIAQLTASWIDSTGTKRANLVLRYYWHVDHRKSEVILGANDDMNVDFQIMPFVKLPPPQKLPEKQQGK